MMDLQEDKGFDTVIVSMAPNGGRYTFMMQRRYRNGPIYFHREHFDDLGKWVKDNVVKIL